MRHFTRIVLATALILFAGCNPFKSEVDELYYEIEQLQNMDDQILNRLESLNSDVSSMLKIVNAIRAGVYIKSIASVTDSEGRDGYVITLNNGETFTIYDGKDGKDGYTPSVGVKKDENDGVYYWTLDGQYMTDATGGKIRADGAKPSFEIRNGYWHISYDGGKTWTNLGQKAAGENGVDGLDGKSQFEVKYKSGANVVTFIMTDTGEEITLPCYQPTTLSFNISDYSTSIAAGETVEIKYNIFNGYENTVVTASSDGNYKVRVDNTNATSGSIFVTCPGLYTDGHISVMAFDGIGYASIYVINFFEKTMSISESSKSFGPDGGYFDVSLTHNFDFYLDFDSKETASWLSIAKVEGNESASKYRINVAKNAGNERTGYVYIYSNNTSGSPFAKIEVKQEGSTFSIENSNFVVAAAATTVSTTIQTTRTLNLTTSDKWIKPTLSEASKGTYTASFAIEANATSAKRGGIVRVMSEGEELATIEIIQLAKGDEHSLDLVFTVRATDATDYTVYLPIKRTEKNAVDCVVDWGDGNQEYVTYKESSPQGAYVYHQYKNIKDSGKDFTVAISGTVKILNMTYVPDGRKASITAVKQWGNTGLTNMKNAFNSDTALTSLPDDTNQAFSNVISFESAFQSCWGIKSLPSGLFTYAKKATSLRSVFYACTSLSNVPKKLFSGCTAVTTFENAFYNCTSLRAVYADIFEGCTKVTSFRSLFYGCTAFNTMPSALFSTNTEVTDFSQAFYGCTSLTAIAKNIFDNNTKVTTFALTFMNCSSIKEIPVGLLNSCTEVTTFDRTFANCTTLTGIPTGLFDNQTMATNFNQTFGGSKNIKGESPYKVIDGKKVHLYERADYPDYFVTPTVFTGCFRTCSQLTDFETISNEYSAWK